MSRFSFGLRPSSQALRACTQSASTPAAKTPSASASSADFGVLLVDADAAFDRDRNFYRLLHRRHAVGHQFRRLHQAGAERAGLHPVGRAADIEVDLVIAERLADARRLGELARIRAAKLQRHRMLFRRSKPSSRSRAPWMTASATTISV